LGGLAIHESQVYTLSKKLNEIQEKYFPGISVPINFHASDIRAGYVNHFNEYDQDERFEIMDDVYDIMHKAYPHNLIAFATCIDNTRYESPYQVTYDCFNSVCQSFNLFLYHRFKERDYVKGMLIIDRGREKQYLDIYGRFKISPHVQEYLANIVDIPYFGACSQTRMLQLADFVSNAVYRYYENDDCENIDKFLHLFYKGDRFRPPARGLNHITQNEECDCYACS